MLGTLVYVVILTLWAAANIHAQQPAAPAVIEEVTGPLVVLVEDYDEHAITRHRVGDIEVTLSPADARRVQPGQHVRIRGKRKGQVLEADEVAVARAPLTGTAGAVGEQRTLVMLVYFRDSAARPDRHRWEVFFAPGGEWDSATRLQSGGLTWWTATITQPMLIDLSYTQACDIHAISVKADAAARAAGYDVGSYPRRVYDWAGGVNCGWKGMSTVGAPSQTWTPVNKAKHELGHALGLHHASALECDTVALCGTPATRTIAEYALCVDEMGSGAGTSFSPAHRELLGWRLDDLVTVTASGRWTLSPLSSAGPGVRGLRIPRANELESVYVEFRSGERYGVVGCEALEQGALLRVRPEWDRKTYWLDMTPQPGLTSKYSEWMSAHLPVGATWRDEESRVSVTVEARTDEALTVAVLVEGTEPPPPPPPPPPTLTIGTAYQDLVAGVSFRLEQVDKAGAVLRLLPLCAGVEVTAGATYLDPATGLVVVVESVGADGLTVRVR